MHQSQSGAQSMMDEKVWFMLPVFVSKTIHRRALHLGALNRMVMAKEALLSHLCYF